MSTWPLLAISLLGICVGLGYKISAVPMHFWCPDVFEGAPFEITTFLSVASKGAAASSRESVDPETAEELADLIADLEREMMKAAERLEFERAADIRDSIKRLSGEREVG
jgi:protein-arginine kinase activator protein McsA